MIPTLDPDPESGFQLFGDSGSRIQDPVNGGIVTAGSSLMILALESICSLLAIPDSDSDPIKSGIVITVPSHPSSTLQASYPMCTYYVH